MRRMLPVDKLAYGANMFKIPSTVERGAMFLKIIAVNKKMLSGINVEYVNRKN